MEQVRTLFSAGDPRTTKMPDPPFVMKGTIIGKQRLLLTDLVLVVHQLDSTTHTKNPYRRLLTSTRYFCDKPLLKLYDLLVHSLTVLYKNHRIHNQEGYYYSSREDNIAALQLMQMIFSPLSVLSLSARNVYRHLKEVFSPEVTFTRKQAEDHSGYSKSHMHRILKELQDHGLIEKSGGYPNTGYHYRLIEIDKHR